MPEHKSFKLSEYDETIRLVLESGGEFRIYPKGTSMLPLIVQGRDSVTLIKPSGELKKGDIAFYLRENGQYVLHRVVKVQNGVYAMCGDNQTEIEHGIENKQIIGVASKIYRGDKLITPKKLSYRLYLFIWRSFFVRRVFFKLRRLKNKIKKR